MSWLFSNSVFFPVFQFFIVGVLFFALRKDFRPLPKTGIGVEVRRGPESMGVLEKYTGMFVAAVITIVNKAAFDDAETGYRHYSVFINLIDLLAIIYVCYLSPWGRNQLIFLYNHTKLERR